MKLNGFSVTISPGTETSDGYVRMTHATVYELVLGNPHSSPCDAEVTIDGGHVGTWRIPIRDNIRIERPVHDTGRFTFYALGTSEARKAQIEPGADTGLITVVFRPGTHLSATTGLHAAPICPGGTGLSGRSRQSFATVEQLNYFKEGEVTIYLRLVATVDEPRPLHKRSTPVPPPLR